jgi:drug/metabolite transporter (DMT)-like permease
VTRAFALLGLAQVTIGAAAIFARFALTAAGPLSISALRLGISGAVVAAIALARGGYRTYDVPTERRLALAGLLLAVHFATWIASLRYASVAVSTLLVCSTPVFTEAWATFRRRRIRGRTVAGIGLALAGVALVAGFPSRTETPLGIVLALTGAVAMAGYLTLVGGADARYETVAVVARTYPIAAVLLGIAALAARDGVPPLAASGAWAGILAMAFGSQLFGHTVLNAAVRALSPTIVSTTTLLEPVIAALCAAAVFGERLAPSTGAGAVTILAAIAVVGGGVRSLET